MKAVLFDLDGVLYERTSPAAGAVEAVQWFRDHQIPHLFIATTSSRPRSARWTKLEALGLEMDVGQVLPPPAAAAEWLAGHGIRKGALRIKPATQAEFSEFEIVDLDPSGLRHHEIIRNVHGSEYRDRMEEWGGWPSLE